MHVTIKVAYDLSVAQWKTTVLFLMDMEDFVLC